MRDIDRGMRVSERERHGRRKLSALGTETSHSSLAWDNDSLASGKLHLCYRQCMMQHWYLTVFASAWHCTPRLANAELPCSSMILD